MNGKQQIIDIFMTNVKGIAVCLPASKHCGQEGHWLETRMGIKHNSKNEADINGYEMKKLSKKITFGDFSATEYIFSSKKNSINQYNLNDVKISRSDFMRYFGNLNIEKNRYSWSGSCVPVYNIWNANGQIMVIENNDIIVYYSFDRDMRANKVNLPEQLQSDIMIAIWKSEKMKPHIDNKFNQNGFFICEKIGNAYEKIRFGKAFNFEYFIECIKNKQIIFDSGMYDGNSRNYSQFRAGANFWNELIIEEY